jgi:hypothetical protein
MNNEKSFLEMIGIFTLAVAVVLIFFWIGWIFIFILFWGIFTIGIFSSVKEAMSEKKYLESLLPIAFCSFFSALLFWMGAGQFSDLIVHSMIEVFIWYPIILISIAIVFVKFIYK